MSIEANKTRLRDFYQKVMTDHNVDLATEYVAENVIENNPPPIPDYPKGLEGFKMGLSLFIRGFPDLKVTILDMVAEGDTVSARTSWTGTHTGSMMGEKPTNKVVTADEIEFFRMDKGMIVEHWGFGNTDQAMASAGIGG